MAFMSKIKTGHDELEVEVGEFGNACTNCSDDRQSEQFIEAKSGTPNGRDCASGKSQGKTTRCMTKGRASHDRGEENERMLRDFFEKLVGTYCARFGGDTSVFFGTLASQNREERRQDERYYIVRTTPREISGQYLPLDYVFNVLDHHAAET